MNQSAISLYDYEFPNAGSWPLPAAAWTQSGTGNATFVGPNDMNITFAAGYVIPIIRLLSKLWSFPSRDLWISSKAVSSTQGAGSGARIGLSFGDFITGYQAYITNNSNANNLRIFKFVGGVGNTLIQVGCPFVNGDVFKFEAVNKGKSRQLNFYRNNSLITTVNDNAYIQLSQFGYQLDVTNPGVGGTLDFGSLMGGYYDNMQSSITRFKGKGIIHAGIEGEDYVT